MRFPRQILLAGMLIELACGKKDFCPGACPDENRFPAMTIQTADGAASIAKANIVNGPCALLLLRSSGEAGVPTGYAAAQVTYYGPADIPPLCLIELTALAGDSVWVTAQVSSRKYQQSCCPYGSCCVEANKTTLHYDMQFDQASQTIAFAPGVDGGQPVDAGEAIDAEGIDLVGESSLAVDADETIDSVDANEEPAIDAANPI